MMNKLSKYFVYMSILCLPMCRPVKQISDTKSTQTNVTLEQRESNSVDTTITFKADSATAALPLSILSSRDDSTPAIAEYFPEYTVKSSTAGIKFKVKHDTLFITATCDSLTQIVTKQKEFISVLRTQRDSLSVNKSTEKLVPFIPKFYKFCFYWFLISATFLTFYAYNKIRKAFTII